MLFFDKFSINKFWSFLKDKKRIISLTSSPRLRKKMLIKRKTTPCYHNNEQTHKKIKGNGPLSKLDAAEMINGHLFGLL